ncbi:hexosaminidase D-like [Musca autumnalis]|uniref:hexosaminidase D-like n=1 Tax=Musca autumnalis TaxID=221902 RepID=UPI003CF2CE04
MNIFSGYTNTMKNEQNKNIIIPKERLVHLDLKGAPPKISFLNKLIEDISQLGATGLLIEYEDMFPFEGNIKVLAAGNAYGREELKNFLKRCVELNLKIIPLVQTFGHMEYALKLKEFAHLRETFTSPQAVCPTHKDTFPFLTSILTQIIEFHRKAVPSATEFGHIHIGCDEVFQIAECNACSQQDKHSIFVKHVARLGKFIKSKWPFLKVIIWDDMLANIPGNLLKNSKLGELVEPMIWSYSARIAEIPREEKWRKYAKIFPTVWSASAYKGASPLPRRIIPPMQKHYDNNRGWLRVMHREHKVFSKGFQGLTLCGWQRYSHFAALCELLPAAIPSLYLNLALISHNDSEGYLQLFKVIKCEIPLELFPGETVQISEYHPLFLNCQYLGHATYKYLLNLSDFIQKVRRYLERLEHEDPYLSFYHVQHNFSLPPRMQEEMERLEGYCHALEHQSKMAYKYLKEIYDEFTIAEFIEQQIYSLLQIVQSYHLNAKKLSKLRYWSQRPFKFSKNNGPVIKYLKY